MPDLEPEHIIRVEAGLDDHAEIHEVTEIQHEELELLAPVVM